MSNLQEMKHLGVRSRQRYLLSVDWYASRKAMEGIDIPTEVCEKAQQARDEISMIRDAATYAEIDHLNLMFT